MPPFEAHRPVVTYLQFAIQVCFPCNDHAQPATYKAPTSITDTCGLNSGIDTWTVSL